MVRHRLSAGSLADHPNGPGVVNERVVPGPAGGKAFPRCGYGHDTVGTVTDRVSAGNQR
jgi:hypothetical protein